MSSRGRSLSPRRIRDSEMEIDNEKMDMPDAKVIIVTNLTRNVVDAHLQIIFGFYGEIIKTDLPVFGKSGQNRGKAALEYATAASAHRAASHMNGGQLDGATLKVELSELPVRSRSRSPRRLPLRHGRDRPRSLTRSRSRTRSRTPPTGGYRRRNAYPPPRDSFRGRPYGRRGPAGRDVYRPGRSRSRTRSRSPPRRGPVGMVPRRRSPSYTRGGYSRPARASRSRSYSVRSSRSPTRSLSRSRSRSRSRSYSSYSRYSRSKSRTRSISRGRRSHSRDDIRDSRSRSPPHKDA